MEKGVNVEMTADTVDTGRLWPAAIGDFLLTKQELGARLLRLRTQWKNVWLERKASDPQMPKDKP